MPVADELLMGDFSARVNARGFIQKIWHNKKDNKKSNGELMLNLTEFVCYHHIHQPVKKKPNISTWMHPKSKHFHLLDYVGLAEQVCQIVHDLGSLNLQEKTLPN